VEAQCRAVQGLADDAVNALKEELAVGVVRIPVRVRNMPLEEFRTRYQGDMDRVLLEDLSRRMEAHRGPGLMTPGKREEGDPPQSFCVCLNL
jgi:hypothetical protein